MPRKSKIKPESEDRILLPHELSLIRQKIKDLGIVQAKHGKLLGEAMTQGAETFHDNAPAEAVRDDQEVLVERARPLLGMLRKHKIIDYPDPESKVVQIGSRVEVQLNKAAAYLLDIVGFRNDSNNEEIEEVSYEAPIAKALLGYMEGDEYDANFNDRTQHVVIISVDQTALNSATFARILKPYLGVPPSLETIIG